MKGARVSPRPCLFPRQGRHMERCVCVVAVLAGGQGSERERALERRRGREGGWEVGGGVCLFLLCFFFPPSSYGNCAHRGKGGRETEQERERESE